MTDIKFFLATFAAISAFTLPALADCKSDLTAVIANTISGGGYHQETSIVSGTTKIAMHGDVIPPDQFDITMPQGRMIMTKAGTWMQHGGKWMKMPDTMRKIVLGQVSMGMSQGMKNMKNLKCLGTQPYDGGSYTAYEFDSSALVMGVASNSHAIVYVTDGRPAVIVIDGQAMGRKSRTIQKLTYDPSITITAPK